MNPIRASKIIEKKYTLSWIDLRGPDSFQQSPVHILPLFASVQINNTVWSETSMPGTSNGHNACNITGFRNQCSLLIARKLVSHGAF
jgi:hypothetical protein